jgi:hypothetical protein
LPYRDLGEAYLDQIGQTRTVANLKRRLERLGYRVTLEPNASTSSPAPGARRGYFHSSYAIRNSVALSLIFASLIRDNSRAADSHAHCSPLLARSARGGRRLRRLARRS